MAMSAPRQRPARAATAPLQAEQHSSQPTRSSSVMDPGQNLSERRKIRQSYRELIQQTTDVRQEVIRPESDGLLKALEKGDELYQDVKMPREAALDSEFLTLTSQYGLEQTKRLHTGFKQYEIGDFVTKLRDQLQGRDAADESGTQDTPAPEALNWLAMGKKYSQCFNGTYRIDFMYGPLIGSEPIAKKQRKKVVREKKGAVVRPEEVQDTQVEGEAETTRRVTDLEKHLMSSKHVDFFEFVMNPKSFGQTVENIFHTAFLIKDGRARIDEKDGEAFLEPAPPPTEQDYQSGKAQRKQCVVRFDYSMWQKLKDKIPTGVIPHRQAGKYEHPGLKQQQLTSSGGLQNGKKGENHQRDDASNDSNEEEEPRKRKPRGRAAKGKERIYSQNGRGGGNSDEEVGGSSSKRRSKGKQKVNDRSEQSEDEEVDYVNESIGSPDVEDNFISDSQQSQSEKVNNQDAYDKEYHNENALADGRKRRRTSGR